MVDRFYRKKPSYHFIQPLKNRNFLLVQAIENLLGIIFMMKIYDVSNGLNCRDYLIGSTRVVVQILQK